MIAWRGSVVVDGEESHVAGAAGSERKLEEQNSVTTLYRVNEKSDNQTTPSSEQEICFLSEAFDVASALCHRIGNTASTAREAGRPKPCSEVKGGNRSAAFRRARCTDNVKMPN